ncbi:DUF6473 family protein [Ruixingdingia sedimenti]|uniref:DUF6473 family protein n=1 Tax=Ruixingdingia sedimenti TaxID=3073604 RepID=A0ABU1F8F1_9RHOB|nr:DUF6473 family protein [Xinfangfangia sp. LG-4]MDR5653142.1 DUF6473 family protein [Xinfangfangia sp. LG-4]
MAYEHPGAGALDYFPCRYAASRLVFRGPRARLDRPYAVALGGIETYGKFIADPWPARLARATGRAVVNLGCVNAGLDSYLADPDLTAIAARADLRVVQVLGAQNLTNRYYAVHPRRNDRFLRATPQLQRLFPDVDFTEFTFTRHLLGALARRGPERFPAVVRELRRCWAERMEALFDRIGGPTILLWIGETAPPPPTAAPRIDRDPPLVDAAMLAAAARRAESLVQVLTGPTDPGPAGKVFAPLEEAAARVLPGPEVHAAIAAALAGRVGR